MNILLITLDQFRGDCLSVLGHPLVRTPHLDRLAGEGVLFTRHYSQAAPCGPGRASLYTGMYQMNHRVVGNGTPLDARFDNVAKAARRAGYAPALFGYTDQAIDPREADGPNDPRLQTYEEVLPGFDAPVHLPSGAPAPWLDWLRARGHKVSGNADAALASEPERPADDSMAAFLTGEAIAWIERQTHPWFMHLSHLRPHPPYAAAGRFAAMYDTAACPASIAPSTDRHWLHEGLMRLLAAPADLAAVKTQYFGMISEVDHQLGRLWDALTALGQWDDTLIIVTADHGEQLGDHGLMQKAGFFEASYHVPCIIRDPRADKTRGQRVERFTENVDIFPTLCEAMGLAVPAQCDGLPLTPFLSGETPPWWRSAAHWEFDWRSTLIASGPHPWPWDRRLERQNLSVLRDERVAYVHFGDGSSLCFDLAADPTWRTACAEPAHILEAAQAMLTWRAQMNDRTMTGMVVTQGGIGRWPPMPAEWQDRNPAVRG